MLLNLGFNYLFVYHFVVNLFSLMTSMRQLTVSPAAYNCFIYHRSTSCVVSKLIRHSGSSTEANFIIRESQELTSMYRRHFGTRDISAQETFRHKRHFGTSDISAQSTSTQPGL